MSKEQLFPQHKGKIEVKMDTPEDRIAAFMISKIEKEELHKGDDKIMRRWLKIWNLLLNYHSASQAVTAHVKMCAEDPDIGAISERTAWYDLKNATRIWGNLNEVPYHASLVLLSEYAMKTFQLAAQQRNVKEMNRAISEMREIRKDLHNISDVGDLDTPTSRFVLIIQTGIEGQAPRTIDLDDYEDLPEDIAHEVIDAVQGQEIETSKFMQIVEEAKNVSED
ncbi:hypothetical protein [Algoriphagus resistens]|uniref:hypothetical protein n=1 Tax=Algoriphagus resistens TaxID=1750590 RepID=UPI000AF2C1A3|nr:hypothetical protein [Algoriphagus resistens]